MSLDATLAKNRYNYKKEKFETPSKARENHILEGIPSERKASINWFFEKGEALYWFRKNAKGESIRLHGRYFSENQNKKLLIFSPGRSEPSVKYSELLHEFSVQNYDLFILDHRGQGFSDSLNDQTAFIHHVDSFSDYSNDFGEIIQEIKQKKKYKKTFLFAHSMGSIISLLAMQKDADLFDACAFCSPMFRIDIRPYPYWVSLIYLRLLILFKQGKKVAYRKETKTLKSSFDRNEVTHSFERFRANYELERRFPQTFYGASSHNWLYEGLKGGKKAFKFKNSKVPMLFFQAGKDTLIRNHFIDRYVNKSSNSRLIKMKESKHEIFYEIDSIRNKAMVQLKKFYLDS
jgi:lysophospholipase